MALPFLIKNASVVNGGKVFVADVLLKDGFIAKIGNHISYEGVVEEIDATGMYLMPGAIDDQVHFREPGLTHKATIATESAAAVAGGITSFMEMPNTSPAATTLTLLEDKYKIASGSSLANYSFYLGTSNDNLDQIKALNPINICGVKIFMGSSTGNLVVDNQESLRAIFQHSPTIITTHCEDDPLIKQNAAAALYKYGSEATAIIHPEIRNVEACYKSSSYAVGLATEFNARLHVLHISTAKELSLFSNDKPLKEKRITAEACVHHLWFSDQDYPVLGNLIKCNPAIKTAVDRAAIRAALLSNHIDVVATDHAPHTLTEKEQPYFNAPSGLPLIQHSLQMMLQLTEDGAMTIPDVVEKMAHNPAILFNIKNRGYIKEGFAADIVLVSKKSYKVTSDKILYKCQWSPLIGTTFSHTIESTFVNGNLVYNGNNVLKSGLGQRLAFDR